MMNKWLHRGGKCALSAMIVFAALAATAEAKTFRWANDGDLAESSNRYRLSGHQRDRAHQGGRASPG